MKKTTKIALVGGVLAMTLMLGFSLMNTGIMPLGDPPFLFFFR